MKVYLVQHAEAKPKDADRDRPLSDMGRTHVEQVAAVAARLGLRIDEVRHSGKTRAEQTAVILAEALVPDRGVRATPGLGPLDDVEPIARELGAMSRPVMLVGHLPFMERLAGRLLAGDAAQAVVKFTNAALVCLVRDGDRWQVAWILTPEMAAALVY